MTCQEFLKGKKVTLMGLGLLGRGVGDAAFIATYADELIVTDIKSEKDLQKSIDALGSFSNITFRLGGHEFEDFRGRDLIVKGAGVPMNSSHIHEAEKWQIPVTMSSALFARFFTGTIIGVTGTKGKSTTAYLIHHIIHESGHKVHFGGNIRGVSTLALLDDVEAGDIVVLELDSWQLQGFEYEKISPHISIFTNFMEDHMDYYKDSMSDYFDDKANIFRYQEKNNYLITEEGVVRTPYFKKEKYKGTLHMREVAEYYTLPKVDTLIGPHNLDNMMYAKMATSLMGVTEKEFEEAVKSFPGVPGRAEFIRNVNNVDVYNDTNASIPIATIQNIRALKERYDRVFLIAGGADKGIDLQELADTINHGVEHVALLAGSGTDRLESMISIVHETYDSLQAAVDALTPFVSEGDCIIMSPAFASFGMFINEYDRGDQFNEIVSRISVN